MEELTTPTPSSGLSDWMPSWAVQDWDRFGAMSEPDREAFVNRLGAFDFGLGFKVDEDGNPTPIADPPHRRELRAHAFSLFVATASGELADVMSKSEGRDISAGEAGTLIMAALADAAQRARYRVATPGGVVTTGSLQEWLLIFPPPDAFGMVRGVRSNFMHLAAGERPRRFLPGWKKKR